MSLINLDQLINKPEVKNKFKLNRILSLRAREIVEGGEGVVPPQTDTSRKPTTQAMLEILEDKIKIVEINEDE